VSTDPPGPPRAAITRARSADELVEFVAADRAGLPFLRHFDADGRQRLVSLPHERGRVTIGRRAENDVSVPGDKQVSAVHAELEHLAGEWLIADEGLSRNGTFVNGERLTGRRRLRDGDSIQVGESQLTYYSPSTRTSSVTSPGRATLRPVALSDTQHEVLAALCRPLLEGDDFALPASNKQVASEVHLSVDAVKAQMRTMFRKFHLEQVPQSEKRMRLAQAALAAGLARRSAP
jgi:hypothetical protein